MHYPDIINMVKVRRDQLNISQETLAEIAGVGLRTLKQIERGKGNPTLSTLFKIADVLGMEFKLEVRKPE
ncbi:MAG: hypothetical protein RL013_2446 [Bacteroidota bacterium]|jgi:transcriptional regulator with XRE-family HTH domain